MKIQVLFFAQLKEEIGKDRILYEVKEGAQVRELVEKLTMEFHLAKWKTLPLLYAVNENFVSDDASLREFDTLALMTPVSGGAL